jgi:hypothetical protein
LESSPSDPKKLIPNRRKKPKIRNNTPKKFGFCAGEAELKFFFNYISKKTLISEKKIQRTKIPSVSRPVAQVDDVRDGIHESPKFAI